MCYYQDHVVWASSLLSSLSILFLSQQRRRSNQNSSEYLWCATVLLGKIKAFIAYVHLLYYADCFQFKLVFLGNALRLPYSEQSILLTVRCIHTVYLYGNPTNCSQLPAFCKDHKTLLQEPLKLSDRHFHSFLLVLWKFTQPKKTSVYINCWFTLF